MGECVCAGVYCVCANMAAQEVKLGQTEGGGGNNASRRKMLKLFYVAL